MKYAYDSLNLNLQAAFESIAPGVETVFARKGAMPTELPDEFLLVVWLNYGSPTNVTNELVAVIQLDIVCSNSDLATALDRAKALDDHYGFNDGMRRALINRCDYNDIVLTEMNLSPMDSGWVEINENNPSIIHLQRTVRLKYTT